jgi:cyclophilin family peptidyl-prolyl cis-trans isomerase
MKRRATAGVALAIGLVVLAACGTDATPTPKPACPTSPPTATGAQASLVDAERAVVATNRGSFTIELYADAAPIAAANFVALARCGFYDGVSFHRVLAGFVIQAGDPQTKSNRGDFAGLGAGGPGYEFDIEPPVDELTYDPYVVAMANDGRTNGSQFFIALADLDPALDRTYTIFGRVSEGTDVVDAIASVPVNDPRMGLPLDPVIIDAITIGPVPSPSPTG